VLLLRSGLLCFFLAIVLTSSLLDCGQVYAIPSSNLIDVPYHAQETNYFCGPASIQMVIEYVSGDVIPQKILAEESKTDPVKGETYSNMTRIPFDKRGYLNVYEAHTTIDGLKEQNSHGYAAIILIWSDTHHKFGHYLVVVGYNGTGIFVNDPWPQDYPEPESRQTGKIAFISNRLLADLWTKFDQWALEVPYTAAPTVCHALSWCAGNLNACITIVVITALAVVIVRLLLLKKRRTVPP